MDPSSHPHPSIEFGPFTVLPHRRELLSNHAPIELGGRAFDVLMALIEARGTVLTRDELMSRVWPAGSSKRTTCRCRSRRCAKRSARTAT